VSTTMPPVEVLSENHVPEPIGFGTRLITLLLVVLPFLSLFAAVVFLWGWGFHWAELGLFLGMYLFTAVGITVGFHRLFTHRSFETNRIVKCILAVSGSMAAEGPLMKWVAMHRLHHQHSDQHEDPHSPHHYGKGVFALLRGLWHAHIGWFFKPDPTDLSHYVKDLGQSRMIRYISALFPVWVLAGLLIPFLLGGLLIGGWGGALFGLLWGGLVRIFFVHHVTWSVNSVCHLWGGKPYGNIDQSRNNFVFGIFALGEGWHNNHHAFPTSARHGLRWWQIDVSYWIIQALALVGLARNVRVPALAARNG
jgi:stearoyl-CoA desaturase (Delta-9 desaturase)